MPQTTTHSEHSTLGASSAERWFSCPASVRLSKGIKSVSSPYADEGTEAHKWLEKCLRGKANPRQVPAENGMREAVTFAFDALRHQLAKAGKYRKVWYEHPVDLTSLHPLLWGTADVVIFNPKTRMLIVCDYKHGAGMLVEVRDNKQLLYYALGAMTNLDVDDIDVVRLQIIQPRCAHPSGNYIRSWDVDPLDLMDFGVDLKKAAKRTENPKAPIVPGDHCQFCPAAAVCPELSKKAMVEAQREFGKINKRTGELPVPKKPEQLAKALAYVPLLKTWIKAVDQYAYQLAVSGQVPEGYKLVEKRANRKWIDEKQTIKVLQADGCSDEQIYEERKLRSPAQIERTCKLTKEEKVAMEKYILKQSSGSVLVPESDNRPALAAGPIGEFEAVGGAE